MSDAIEIVEMPVVPIEAEPLPDEAIDEPPVVRPVRIRPSAPPPVETLLEARPRPLPVSIPVPADRERPRPQVALAMMVIVALLATLVVAMTILLYAIYAGLKSVPRPKKTAGDGSPPALVVTSSAVAQQPG